MEVVLWIRAASTFLVHLIQLLVHLRHSIVLGWFRLSSWQAVILRFLHDSEFDFDFRLIFFRYIIINNQLAQERHITLDDINYSGHFSLLIIELSILCILVLVLWLNCRLSLFRLIPWAENDVFTLLINKRLFLESIRNSIKLILDIIEFAHSTLQRYLLHMRNLFNESSKSLYLLTFSILALQWLRQTITKTEGRTWFSEEILIALALVQENIIIFIMCRVESRLSLILRYLIQIWSAAGDEISLLNPFDIILCQVHHSPMHFRL